MTATMFGVVHADGIVLRIIVPDADSELDDPAYVRPGETMLMLARVDYPIRDKDTLTAAITAATDIIATRSGGAVSLPIGAVDPYPGVQDDTLPPSGRCLVVNARGVVAGVIMANPRLNVVDGCTLLRTDAAVDVGWTWDGAAFVDPNPPLPSERKEP